MFLALLGKKSFPTKKLREVLLRIYILRLALNIILARLGTDSTDIQQSIDSDDDSSSVYQQNL